MLSEEKNHLLTRVGPGTPMGALLRRYWMPIAATSDFASKATHAVRLMGEDLVLYKDLNGHFGLLSRQCAHRRADLCYGLPEHSGLRCSYHGWLYDKSGQCIAQPYEDVAYPEMRLREKIKITGYPVEEKGGLLWAYLGPEPRPLLPDWEFFHWKNGFVQIVYADLPCNWLQCQENSIDPIHFEWMHMNWSIRRSGALGQYGPKHTRLEFAEFEYGFQYKRIMEGTSASHPLWTVGRVCLWPNALFTGHHIEYRVPVDDENTLSVTWSFTPVPKERAPYIQSAIPAWKGQIKQEKTGQLIDSHVMNQDFIAWIGQGRIADRTQEHLAQSDRGILMLRHRFLADLERLARDEDPKAVIRNPAINRCVRLPVADRSFLEPSELSESARQTRAAARDYALQAGQPENVANAFREAMGDTAADAHSRVLPNMDVL
jgi:5,5'-dehydrodivanillate O-demethylase oxygenase subunit